jgi:hypothetical protein
MFNFPKAVIQCVGSALAFASAAVCAQTLTVSPSALAFGLLPQSSTTALTATVTNSGASPVTITAIDFGDSLIFARAGGTCATNLPSSLAGNASCTISVRSAPFTVRGTYFAALNVRTASAVVSTPISATITQPPLFSVESVDFGTATSASGFSARRVELTNNNAFAVTFSAISGSPIAADNAATTPSRYLTTGSCFTSLQTNAPLIPSLAAGAKCSIDVLPILTDAVGSYASTITITSSDGPITLPVTARIGPTPDALIAAPNAISLGTAPTGATVSKLITLRNTSTTDTIVEDVRLPSDVVVAENSCGERLQFTIAAQANCSMLLNITLPATLGAYSAGVDIASTKGNVTIPVSATVVSSAASLSLSPATLNFGVVAPARGSVFPTLTLTYTNTTASAVNLVGLSGGATASAGNNALAWFATSGSCYVSNAPEAAMRSALAPGERCTIDVSVQKTARGTGLGVSSWSDSISLVTSAGVSTAVVTAAINTYFRFNTPPIDYGALEAQPSALRLTRLTQAGASDSGQVTFSSPYVSVPDAQVDTINFVVVPPPFVRSGGTCPSTYPAQSSPGCTMIFSVPANSLPASAETFRAKAVVGFSRANIGIDLSLATGAPEANSDGDGDGIPYSVEIAEGRDPDLKDNAIFAGGAPLSNRWFAMQQYRDFLGREADPAGLADWTNRLSTNALTREEVIQGFFGSPEFQSGVPSVVRLYLGFFKRIPDSGGLKGWVAQLRTGTSINTIASAFTRSQEFQNTYGALTNSEFITLVYRNVLGRAPDTAGFNDWTSRLNGGLSRGDMMVGFTESTEFQMQSAPNVFVIMMYEGLLRRAAEQAGYEFWVDYIISGKNALDLTRGFLNSQEYRNRFLP